MIYFYNKQSEEVFKRFPAVLQAWIIKQQDLIEALVVKHVPDAECTSGFRDPVYNRMVEGKSDSLHQWGCARDYKKKGVWPKLIPGLQIIDEGDHYHVQFVRCF